MSTFAISDIHGRLKELELLLEYIDHKPEDTVIFLGDYIDRGPNSKEVIEKLIEFKANMENFHFLKGNHEEMAITARVDGEARRFWLAHGGDKTVENYSGRIPPAHWDFMFSLEKYIETNDSIFVHGGIDESVKMEEQDNKTLIWKRVFEPLHHFTGKKIYCGHTTQMFGYPALMGDARCIDCLDWLTAINVDTDQVYQVNEAEVKRNFDINNY